MVFLPYTNLTSLYPWVSLPPSARPSNNGCALQEGGFRVNVGSTNRAAVEMCQAKLDTGT